MPTTDPLAALLSARNALKRRRKATQLLDELAAKIAEMVELDAKKANKKGKRTRRE